MTKMGESDFNRNKANSLAEHINNMFNTSDLREVSVPDLTRNEANALCDAVKKYNYFKLKLRAKTELYHTVEDSYTLIIRK